MLLLRGEAKAKQLPSPGHVDDLVVVDQMGVSANAAGVFTSSSSSSAMTGTKLVSEGEAVNVNAEAIAYSGSAEGMSKAKSDGRLLLSAYSTARQQAEAAAVGKGLREKKVEYTISTTATTAAATATTTTIDATTATLSSLQAIQHCDPLISRQKWMRSWLEGNKAKSSLAAETGLPRSGFLVADSRVAPDRAFVPSSLSSPAAFVVTPSSLYLEPEPLEHQERLQGGGHHLHHLQVVDCSVFRSGSMCIRNNGPHSLDVKLASSDPRLVVSTNRLCISSHSDVW